ncbi:alpha/beta hydrolase, partial [Streptomyces lydicus]
ERQRALAAQLGGRFAVAAPAGHLVMADVPASVARAVLDLSGTDRDVPAPLP